MFRLPILVSLGFVLASMLSTPAFAEKRIALVVGNSGYRNVPALDNPANDAKLLANTLSGLGFTLVGGGAQLDLDKASLDRAVQAFGAQLAGADVGLFYYAGHGVQVRGENYLIPVDANPTKEADVDFQMLDANVVLHQMEGAGTRLNIVILDACRNNPFGGRSLALALQPGPAPHVAASTRSAKLPKSKGHHTWTDDEIEKYRSYWPLGTQQRLVMEFALETASRRGEVVRLGPQHVKDGRIRIERTHGSKDVDMLMSAALRSACDAMPKAHLTYIVTAQGKPRSKYGLGNDFARWVTEAALPKHCRLHGLKKGGMRRLAEDGATAHELTRISHTIIA